MDTIPNLITRIVIAEFDIDKGSCIRTQYPPAEAGPDDGYIAEQLLPDGSEKHALGRSYIVLGHRKPSSSFSVPARYVRDVDTFMADVRSAIAASKGSSEASPTSPTGSVAPLPLLEDILTIDAEYINVRRLGEVLYRVRHSESVVSLSTRELPSEWEGAIACVTLTVQPSSTSSGSSSSVALFISPAAVDQLKRLVEEYRGGDGASHLTGDALPTSGSKGGSAYPTPLFAVAATMTKKDATVRRGGITKGVAFIGPDLVQLGAMWPAIELLVKRCCDVKGTDQDAIDAQYEIIRALYCEISNEVAAMGGRPNATPEAKRISAAAVLRGDAATADSGSAFSGNAVDPWLSLRSTMNGQLKTVRIQNSGISGTDVIALPPPKTPVWFMPLSTFGVAEVLAAFKENFAAILTALMCGRRIVVKGFGCPSTVVSEAVIAIGIIGSCIVPDFITTRVFPYSSITFMDKFMGLGAPYVVGTLNPMYDSRSEWWDLLCDLDTGAVTAGISTKMLTMEAPHVEADKDFCRQLMQCLASTGGYLGHDRNVVEQGIRERIAEYVATIMAAAAHADHTSKMPLPIRQLLEANHKRLMLTQLGGLFDTFVDKHLGGGDIGRVELQLAVAALRRNEGASDEDVIQALQSILRRVEGGAQGPHNLLSILPQATGGIAPIANQLMNPHMAIRVVALEVLSRLEGIPLGKKAMGCLNSFVLLAYEQIRADMASLRR